MARTMFSRPRTGPQKRQIVLAVLRACVTAHHSVVAAWNATRTVDVPFQERRRGEPRRRPRASDEWPELSAENWRALVAHCDDIIMRVGALRAMALTEAAHAERNSAA